MELPPCRISSAVHSTTLPPLRIVVGASYRDASAQTRSQIRRGVRPDLPRRRGLRGCNRKDVSLVSPGRALMPTDDPAPGMTRYSAFRLAREALRGHRGWKPAWRKAEPKAAYDTVIVGGGGHGLATAYYLVARHGITDVAVLERSAIGLGNVGRNTTIVRSNY